MPAVREISYRRGRIIRAERIDYDELYLHALRQNALYIHARVVAVPDSIAVFRKPRKVRRQLDKDAVFLNGADYSRNGFARLERDGIFLPGAQQLAVRERETPQLVAAFDYGADVLPRKNRAFGCGMRDTEMLSMGSSALIPAPMSQNAPKGSMCVTHASITSPQTSDDRYSRLQSS